MNEAQLKGKEFLDYIAENQNQLKKEFKKGIAYNKETFEDIWQTTIVKVYNSIVKNNKAINNFKNYFYFALKFESILDLKRNNKKSNYVEWDIDTNDEIENPYDIEIDEKYLIKYSAIRDIVIKKFGENEADIFFDFMLKRMQTTMTSKKYADLTGLQREYICKLTTKIRTFLKSDNIKKIYKELNNID